MNKTISINLGGRNFFIEEEAYKKLEAYLNSIKARFAEYQGSAEIVADMESRIGEKFSEKFEDNSQAVITDADIDNLISELGSVEDIAGEAGNKNSGKQSYEGYTQKRLMRNGDDKIIAGVCSGLAAYFDIDPIIFRGIFVILIFAWGAIIPIYFVLWLIMPEAKTLNDKMQMRGKVFNLDNISETVKERAEEFKEHVTSVKTKEEWKKWGEDLKNQAHKVKDDAKDWGKDVEKEMKEKFGSEDKTEKKTEQPQPVPPSQSEQMRPARGGFGNFLRQIFQGLGKIIMFFVKLIVGIVGFVITISLSIGIAALTISIAIALFNSHSQYIGFPLSAISHGAPYYFLLIIGYVIALIPLIFLIILGSSLLSRRNQFNAGVSISMFAFWVMALAIGGIVGMRYVPGYIEQIKNSPQVQIVSKSFDAKDFKNLDLSNSGNFHLVQGKTFSVKATGWAADLDRLDVAVNNQTLSISEGSHKFCVFCFSGNPTIEITAPQFDSITGHNSVSIDSDAVTATTTSLTLTNSSEAKINYQIKQLTLSLSNSSSAELNAIGTSTIDTLTAKLSNSSELNALNLPAKNADITTSNSSSASVYVTGILKYNSYNSSEIKYLGTPQLVGSPNPDDVPVPANPKNTNYDFNSY